MSLVEDSSKRGGGRKIVASNTQDKEALKLIAQKTSATNVASPTKFEKQCVSDADKIVSICDKMKRSRKGERRKLRNMNSLSKSFYNRMLSRTEEAI